MKLVLVEDNPVVLDLWRSWFRGRGFEVASSGLNLGEVDGGKGPVSGVDGVLVDFGAMADIGAPGSVSWLRNHFVGARVVVVTGSPELAKSCGADLVIDKGSGVAGLVEVEGFLRAL